MIVVLAFCGYLASVNAAGVYVGGVIAIVDLLIMLVLFFGLRPEHLTETGRARKRRLSRLRARPVTQLVLHLCLVPGTRPAGLRVAQHWAGQRPAVPGNIGRAILRVTAEIGGRLARDDVAEVPHATVRQ